MFTLTGNLLAERTLDFPSWAPGRTQRAIAESFQVGGKGINVSKMLRRLHTPSTALCFTGGATGTECEAWLRERQFDYRAFPNSMATRSGIVVRDTRHAHAETTFLGPDVPPDAAAVRACAAFLDAQPPGQVLAVCGSIPGWREAYFDCLREALAHWAQRGTVVADTYGPPLRWFAELAAPVLIKINLDELRTLTPEPDIGATLNQFVVQRPASRWIVSDGPHAVWFADTSTPAASLTPPRVAEVSPTGSGDVLLACVLHALFVHRRALRTAVAFALPFSAANAAHKGIADFDLPSNVVPPVDPLPAAG